jgi:hypothetical protein
MKTVIDKGNLAKVHKSKQFQLGGYIHKTFGIGPRALLMTLLNIDYPEHGIETINSSVAELAWVEGLMIAGFYRYQRKCLDIADKAMARLS